jgi:hypothetical protein
MSEQIHAYQIAGALAKRHRDELFFTEVKNGSSWFTSAGNGFRMDALAIKKSWAHPCITGYEIKVSRSDWLKDTKFTNYMEYCNELWVVCPAGVVIPTEIPANVGLKTYLPGSGMIKTVIKAAYRKIEPPVDMFIYLLMQYAQSNRRPVPKEDKREIIAQYLDNKLEGHRLANAFKGKLIERAAKVEDLEKRNESLREANADQKKTIDDATKLLYDKLGHAVWNIRYGIEDLIKEAGTGYSDKAVLGLVQAGYGAMLDTIRAKLGKDGDAT